MKNLTTLFASIALSSNAISQNTDSAIFYFNKGLVEKEAKRYLSAAGFFDKAIGFDSHNTAALEQDGNVNLFMHKTDIALRHFTNLYQQQPSNEVAVKELAALYFSYHQYAKAIEFAEKCKGCSGNERIIAMSSYHLEDYQAAIKGLLNVIAKNPRDGEAFYTIGRSYLDMELYAKAVPYYIKAIESDSTRSGWMNELGLLFYNLNDFKQSVNYFTKAKEHGYPVTNDFNENLGYAYIYSGQFDKGEKLLLAILSKKPGNKDILRDIAEAYYKQKVFDKSLDFCRQLIELDANDARALYQAGMCFQQKGQKEKGQSMCDNAIKLDPSLSGLRQKLDGGIGL
jgi:tetratricopeptide (TPR) repeat protein